MDMIARLLLTFVGLFWIAGCAERETEEAPVAESKAVPGVEPTAETNVALTGAPQVVYLTRTDNFYIRHFNSSFRSPLRHEFVRQAFLIAVREEMGIATRDAVLGERVPTETPHLHFEFTIVTGTDDRPNQLILWKAAPQREQLATWELSKNEGVFHYRDKLLELEPFSRREFVEVLEQCGLKRRTVERRADATVSEECQHWIESMNCFDQFQAIRHLHAQIQREGDNEALLTGLVRAYAHLGMLTEHYWLPIHETFKARALLYAQRLCDREPENPTGFALRAYAFALAGAHAAALTDLQAAQGLRKSDQAPASWEGMIESHLKFDLQGQRLAADHPQQNLSQLLYFINCEQSGGLVQTVQAGLAALESLPDCYRIHDGVAQIAGVALGHRITLQGPQRFRETLYSRLQTVADLPREIGELVKEHLSEDPEQGSEYPVRRRLMSLLAAATVSSKESSKELDEFSFPILGQMIAETTFTQIVRRTHFLKSMLGVSTDDFLDSIEPLVADHPYRTVLDATRTDPQAAAAALKTARTLSDRYLQFQARMYVDIFLNVDETERMRRYWMLNDNTEYLARGITQGIANKADHLHAELGRQLLIASPHAPLGRALLLPQNPVQYEKEKAEWEAQAEEHSRLARALGRHFRVTRKFPEAVRFYRASIAIAPDFNAYEGLATAYAQQDKFDEWQAVYEEFLKQPDYALYHAEVRIRIADYYCRNRQWKKALPFSEAAAQSFSSRSLTTFGRNLEALGRWDEAESIYRAVGQRYSVEYYWLAFCRRTGHGDAKSARVSAQQFLRRKELTPNALSDPIMALVQVLNEEPKKALPILQRSFIDSPDPLIGLWAVLVADRLKNAAMRDALLTEIATRSGGFVSNGLSRAPLVKLAKLFEKDLAAGGKGEFDLAELEKLCLECPQLDRYLCAFMVGEYLAIHGRLEAAKPFWARCAEPVEENFFRTFASWRLVEQGIAPEDFSQLLDQSRNDVWKLQLGFE